MNRLPVRERHPSDTVEQRAVDVNPDEANHGVEVRGSNAPAAAYQPFSATPAAGRQRLTELT
jgi:hypothetical protein